MVEYRVFFRYLAQDERTDAYMKKVIFRTVVRALLLLAATCLVLLWYLYFKDYAPYWHDRKGTLLRSSMSSAGESGYLRKWWVRIENGGGFNVDCGLLTPPDTARRYPAIVLLGGKTTGKYAIDYALDIKDVIIIAPDYPYTPRDRYTLLQFLEDLPAMRQALLDMVPAVMLVTDYLWQRPDVDTTKVILLGYSFGAPFVPCLLAHDRRAGIAAMVYGGGDLRSLITHNVGRYEGPLVSECVGDLGGVLLRPLEPLRYIERVSPTPLIMINGTRDEQIPRAYVEILFQRAREPKKLIWLDTKHVHWKNVELTRLIVKILSRELEQQGILAGESTAGEARGR